MKLVRGRIFTITYFLFTFDLTRSSKNLRDEDIVYLSSSNEADESVTGGDSLFTLCR